MSWAGQPKTFAPGFARAGAAPDPARLRQAGGAANPRAGKEALERASYLGEMPSLNQDQHPPPLSYAQMIRQVRSKYDLGLRLVESAKHIGIKPTARLYGASPQTVRKWLRRYQAQKRSGLADRSHAPLTCPHKTPKHLEQRVIAAREQTGFGAARLRAEFELPVSVGAIARILRHAGLVRPRKRKHTTKQDLRAVKATWAVFSKLCHDTKDLDDIPYYWPQAKALGLPVIQYTAREVRTGLTFADYAQQRSASLACVFAERVMAHLTACGVPLDEVGFQSDNGSEYAGGKATSPYEAGIIAASPMASNPPGKPPELPTPSSPLPPTPTKAMSRPCTGYARTSSSTAPTRRGQPHPLPGKGPKLLALLQCRSP